MIFKLLSYQRSLSLFPYSLYSAQAAPFVLCSFLISLSDMCLAFAGSLKSTLLLTSLFVKLFHFENEATSQPPIQTSLDALCIKDIALDHSSFFSFDPKTFIFFFQRSNIYSHETNSQHQLMFLANTCQPRIKNKTTL